MVTTEAARKPNGWGQSAWFLVLPLSGCVTYCVGEPWPSAPPWSLLRVGLQHQKETRRHVRPACPAVFPRARGEPPVWNPIPQDAPCELLLDIHLLPPCFLWTAMEAFCAIFRTFILISCFSANGPGASCRVSCGFSCQSCPFVESTQIF